MGRSVETDVEEAKQTISDLFGRIIEIKEKAAHSEELVQVICKYSFPILYYLEIYPNWMQLSVILLKA